MSWRRQDADDAVTTRELERAEITRQSNVCQRATCSNHIAAAAAAVSRYSVLVTQLKPA